MLKQISVNIILVLLFAMLVMAIIMPFLANMQFNAGKALEAKYRWKTAAEGFDLAVRLDPLSAEYHGDIGELYMERADILKNKVPTLLKAEGRYKKAKGLNP